jgi:hypothetical protein
MSADEVLKTFNKAIDEVMKQPPGPKRWRAANTMWLRLSPRHQMQYKLVVQENEKTRELLRAAHNKYNTSSDKNSNLRQFLNIPTGAYYAIEKADPYVFKKKENAAKFFREFKEYTTAETY